MHAVAFLNHLGIFRNFNQVIVLNNKFTRDTIYKKKRNTLISAVSDPSFPPLFIYDDTEL